MNKLIKFEVSAIENEFVTDYLFEIDITGSTSAYTVDVNLFILDDNRNIVDEASFKQLTKEQLSEGALTEVLNSDLVSISEQTRTVLASDMEDALGSAIDHFNKNVKSEPYFFGNTSRFVSTLCKSHMATIELNGSKESPGLIDASIIVLNCDVLGMDTTQLVGVDEATIYKQDFTDSIQRADIIDYGPEARSPQDQIESYNQIIKKDLVDTLKTLKIPYGYEPSKEKTASAIDIDLAV
jgi:hypothetical protein